MSDSDGSGRGGVIAMGGRQLEDRERRKLDMWDELVDPWEQRLERVERIYKEVETEWRCPADDAHRAIPQPRRCCCGPCGVLAELDEAIEVLRKGKQVADRAVRVASSWSEGHNIDLSAIIAFSHDWEQLRGKIRRLKRQGRLANGE